MKALRRKLTLVTAVLAVLLAAVGLAIASRAGQLDRSFGNNGIVWLRDARGFASAVAVGGHNRIVVVGGRDDLHAFTVGRLLGNGDVDTRFGDHGIVPVGFGSDVARATSVAIGRQGAIVVGGTVCSDRENCHFAVARLLRNGEIDRNFGGDGTVEVDLPRPYGFDPAVALGGHGRIVLAGSDCSSSRVRNCDIALAALRRDGTLDPQFGDSGKLVSSFARAGDSCPKGYLSGSVRGMAVDSQDRIVVGGECSSGQRAALARFTRRGELDRTFGNGGRVDRDVSMGRVRALAIDARDRIDTVGEVGPAFVVARFGTAGRLDRSFGGDGTARIRFARHQGDWARKHHVVPYSVDVDSHGRIVIGGSHAGGFAFARFKRNGRVNRDFGHGGRVIVTGKDKDLLWTGTVAVDSRDRVIGSGAATVFGGPPGRRFAVIRLVG